MLRELAQGDRTVGQLAGPFEMSLAGANEGLRIDELFWNTRLDELERLLRSPPSPNPKKPKTPPPKGRP